MTYLPRVFTRATYQYPRRKFLIPVKEPYLLTDTLTLTQHISFREVTTDTDDLLQLYQTIDVSLRTNSIAASFNHQCIGHVLDLQQSYNYSRGKYFSINITHQLNLKQFCISYIVDRSNVILTQKTIHQILPLSQIINISFTVLGASVFNESLISYLNLRQDVTVTKGNLIYRSITHTLSFNQTITETSGNTIVRLVFQPITFNDTLLYSKGLVYSESVSSPLTLTQHITISTPNVTQESIVQILPLSQDIGHSFEQIIPEIVSHTLSFTQSIVRHLVYHRTVSSPLTLTQTITKQKVVSELVSDTLILIDTITLSANYNRSIVQRLEFLEPYYQIALSYNNIIDVPVVTIIKTKRRNFSVNYQSNGSVITLPSPDWEDTESLDNALVIKRTMTGGVFTYVKQVPIRVLQYKFSLGRLKIFELEKFLIDTNAQPVMMHNWKDELWAGYITNNPIDITENREYDNEISIQFQGVRIG